MTARILLAAIAAFFISTARADEPKSVGKQLVSAAEAVTTTGPGFSSDGKAQRIVATGISTATVTVYGTNVYCGKTCSASSTSATSVGTITSSGDSVDNQTYLYYFALVTAYTSGTIDVTMTEQPAGGAGSSSSSPAYVTPVDASGDSLANATANALNVTGASTSGACSNADVDTIETLCTITVTGYDRCTLTFTVATAILSDFNVDLANDATTFITVATTATDYTSPQGHIFGASGDLTVAATSGTHWIQVDNLGGFDTLRFQAAGTSSAVTGTYRCQ